MPWGQLTQRVVEGIPAARWRMLKSLAIMPDHPVAAAIHASIVMRGPAAVAIHVAGVARVMHTICCLVPLLRRSGMLQVICINGLNCTCVDAADVSFLSLACFPSTLITGSGQLISRLETK